MNSKSKITISILTIIIVLLFYNNIFVNNQLNKNKKLNESLYKEIERNYFPAADLIYHSKQVAEVIYNYLDFKPILNKDIEKGKLLLIYRYSEFTCDGCIQEDLSELESILNEIGKDHILVLPAFAENRENKIKLYNKLNKFNYKNITLESFKIPLEYNNDTKIRFFALINNLGDLNMIFFPQRSNPHLTKNYFIEIKKILNTGYIK